MRNYLTTILLITVLLSTFEEGFAQNNFSRYDVGIVDDLLQGKWIERGASNQAGKVVYAHYDSASNEITCASAGGNLWLTNADSIEWRPLNDQFRIDKILGFNRIQHPGLERWNVITTDGRSWVSDDTCKTWVEGTGLENIQKTGFLRKVVWGGDSAVFVLGQERHISQGERYSLFRSMDGGKSFTRLSSHPQNQYGFVTLLNLYSISPTDEDVFFYYRDSLSIFDTRTGQRRQAGRMVTFNWGQVFLTGERYGDSLHLYVFVEKDLYLTNGSATAMTRVGRFDEFPYSTNSLASSFSDTNALFVGTEELFSTDDRGSNWTRLNSGMGYYENPADSLHYDISYLGRFFKKGGAPFHLCGTGGGLYRSDDDFKSVENISLQDHNNSQYFNTYTVPGGDMVFAGSIDQGLQRISDTSSSIWKFEQAIPGSFGHLSSGDSGKSLWMINSTTAAYMVDAQNDTSFSGQWDFVDSLTPGHDFPPLVVDPYHANRAYLLGVYDNTTPNKEAQIFELEFGNQLTFKARPFNFNLAPTKDEWPSGLSISRLDSTHWYAVTNKGNFYYSFDAGANWNRSSFFTGPGPVAQYGTTIYPSTSNLNYVYLAGDGGSGGSVYFSWNKGRDWRQLGSNPPTEIVYGLKGNYNDSLIFASTGRGAYVFSQKESSWYSMNVDSVPRQIFWSAEYLEENNTVRFSTFGRGIWDFAIESADTTVGVNAPISEDKGFILFPNPASERIYIKGLNEGDYVRVYNAEGKNFIRLPYSLEGIEISALKPGVYFLKVESGGWSSKFIVGDR